jgi:parallel beta-helix repeat protein
MSQEQNKLAWRILHASVTGASHVRARVPNQDAILYKQNSEVGVPLVLSIADGHGSKKYFRSHTGSQFAVQAAEKVLHTFVRGLKEQGRPLSEIESMAQRVPLDIVEHWRRLVEDHWCSSPPNDQEWPWMTKEENANAWQAIGANHTLAYGTTLLAVLVTDAFILYFQLGDGDILTVSTAGEVLEPVPTDQRNLANETTSLCNPTAKRDFRIVFQRLVHPKPALILLSTDGYSNSFENRADFHKVGSDIWHLICSQGEKGIQQVEKDLEGWLTRTTQVGSGDDITVGLLCRMSALAEPIVISPPIAFPKEKAGSLAEQQSAIRGDTRPTLSPLSDLDKQDQIDGQEAKERAVSGEPPVAVAGQQQTLIVSQVDQGENYYPSIAAALQSARPHARILVKPGIYSEQLLIEKPVQIIGMGPYQKIIIQCNTPCVRIKAESAVLKDITFQGRGESESNSAALEIFQGQVTIYQCDVTSQTKYCIAMLGENVHTELEQCYIHDGAGYGIVFDKQSEGQVKDCHVVNNAFGIGIWRNSTATVSNCTISANVKLGVFLSEGSRGEFIESTIEQENHQGKGITIRKEAEARLQGCQIHGAEIGVMVDGKGVQIKDRTRIDDNKIGILVKNENGADDSWFVFLKESTIGETNAIGIKINDNQLAAQDCQLQDNGLYMIKALPDGHVVFEREH